MKLTLMSRRKRAFTMTELFVVMVLLLFLAVGVMYFVALVPATGRHRGASATRIKCANNLKQVGLAYKVFANDNDDKFPFLITNSLAFGNVTQAWLHFQAMSNELGSARILICPSDSGRYNNMMSEFGMGAAANPASLVTKGNSAVSYTASLDADETLPNVILASDRHLLTNRFNLGGRLFLAGSNATSTSWTTNLHSGAGNFALSDGSVQQVSSSGLGWQVRFQGIPTNRLLLPLHP